MVETLPSQATRDSDQSWARSLPFRSRRPRPGNLDARFIRNAVARSKSVRSNTTVSSTGTTNSDASRFSHENAPNSVAAAAYTSKAGQGDVRLTAVRGSVISLDGEIDREEAITLNQKYKLSPRDVAEQSLKFDRDYRSYIINYSVGEDLVRSYVDRAGSDPAARWAAYEHILSTPTLPADLAK